MILPSILLLLLLISHPSSGINTVCQAPIQGSTTLNYSVCMADAQRILLPNNTIFKLQVEPPSITCGATLQAYCTSVLPMECFNCSSTLPSLSHTKEMLVDVVQGSTSQPDYRTSWQSQTWRSLGFLPIATIRISMGRRFILQDDIIFTFAGGRPKVAILEKSLDNGVTWSALQFFNRTCSNPNVKTTITQATDVICTQEYSSPNPLAGGALKFDLNRDRLKIYLGALFTDYERLYSAYETTSLLEFLTFTDIRLRLLYPATDGNEFSGPPSDLLKYYYSVSNIYLVGGCDCNRHAKFCEPIAGAMRCICKHNTAGINCDRCLPLFNNRPWAQGSFKRMPGGGPLQGTANECQKCQCYNKADKCAFDASSGQGRCLDCQHNSQGDNCDECKYGFFRNSTSSIHDVDMCSACICQPLGIADDDRSCLDITGQCKCKPGVLGTTCNLCFDGTWGLLSTDSTRGTCKACTCNREWTVDNRNVCDQMTGQCHCITGVHSTNCTLCQNGYYRKRASEINQQNCVPCLCNWGGSSDQTCDKTTSQCPCKPHLIGSTCSLTSPHFFTPLPDYITIKPDHPSPLTTCEALTDIQSSPISFSGRFYSLCFANATNQLATFSDILANVPKQGSLIQTYIPILRFGLDGSRNYGQVQLTITPDGQKTLFNESKYPEAKTSACNPAYLASTFNLYNIHTGFGNALINNSATVELDARCKYKATVRAMNGGASTHGIIIDSIVLLPSYKNSLFYIHKVSEAKRKQYEMCIENLLPLYQRDLEGLLKRPDCVHFYFALMTQQIGKALACDCDSVGSKPTTECQRIGGQCQCQENVGGRRCDQCLRGFYDFAATGCRACNCNKNGSSNAVCDYSTGQCPCRPNVATSSDTASTGGPADSTCRLCKQHYYGVASQNGCLKCHCNSIGSASLQCDAVGVCACKESVGGEKCDRCLHGYYGFSSAGCIKCNCSEAGSVNGTCSNTGTCLCKANTEAFKCNLCKPKTFNLASTNPDGCQLCFCSKLGQGSCTPAVGFKKAFVLSPNVTSWTVDPQFKSRVEAPSTFLGNRISSYAQTLSFTYYPTESFLIGREFIVTLVSKDLRRISYSPPSLNFTALEALTIHLLLHQSLFQDDTNPSTPLTAMDMYEVLSKLSSLTIQRSFLGRYEVGISQVVMTTALPANPGDAAVNYVENCTCINSTAGLSCERCLSGFKRKDPNFEDSQCQACSCLGLTPATQSCDQLTGQCLNCPNGSLGNSCELCAPNVVKSQSGQCDQCAPRHWGLSQTGCTACDCSSPGSVDLSSCHLITGQCTCQSNVTGMTCDRCKDGYVNMTVVGCSPCVGCYGLVVKEMDKLVVMLNDQSTTLETVRLRPPNNFSLRLNTALDQADFLNNYNLAFFIDNATLRTNLYNVSELYKTLDNVLATIIKPKWRVLGALEGATNSSQHSIQRVLKDTSESLVIVSLATPAIQRNTDKLTSLKNSIEGIKNLLESGIQPLIFGFNTLNNTVNRIETNSLSLNEMINDIRSNKVPRAVGHNQQIHDNIVTIDLTVLTLNRSAQGLMNKAQNVKARGAYLTNRTTMLFNRIRDIRMTSVDVQGVSNNVSLSLPNLARQLTAAAQSSQLEASFVGTTIENITSTTNQLLSLVDSQLEELKVLGNRVDAANETAYGSVEAAQSTVTSAMNMLDVMRNFNRKSSTLQSQASGAIQSAQAILGMCQLAINSSRGISNSIRPSIDTSTLALATTKNFFDQCKRFRRDIQPVHSKAINLFSEAAAQLNDVTFKQETASISPISTFRPLLINQQNRAGQLETTALTLRGDIESVTGNFSSSKQLLQTLLNKINTVVPPVTAQTTTLLSECEALKQTFQSMSLSSTVVTLQGVSGRIRGWVGELKNKKVQLQSKVNRLRLVLGQLI